MTDPIERNLDSLARRMADIDSAMDDALSDPVQPAELPVAEKPLSYSEVTEFNDDLRARFGWDDVDLDALLTTEHRRELQAWRERHRQAWTIRDLATVGIAGLVGAVCVWFDSTIDREVRGQFRRLADTERVREWERAGKRLPIDYMGAGFGGRAHRIKSGGHDLLRVFSSMQQILDSQFRGVYYENGHRIGISVDGRFDEVESWPDAALRLIQHLAADFLTPMSLPVPGLSWVCEAGDETARQFALHAYSGLRAGEGWSLRNATVVPTLSTVATELLIRTHIGAESLQGPGSFTELTPRQRRKQNELLLAAHTLVATSSMGKATAQLFAMQSKGTTPHPAMIKHVQLPALIRAGWSAVDVVNDARTAAQHSARSWDELVLDTAHIHQLDLPSQLEVRLDM